MAGIQLENKSYGDYQAYSTKKQLDGKDPNNLMSADGKSPVPTRIGYVIFKIENLKDAAGKIAETIVTEKIGYAPKHGTKESDMKEEMLAHPALWAQFIKDLTASKLPRFGVCDVFKTFADGHIEQRAGVIRYSPDSAATKPKLMYSTAEGNFKGKLAVAKCIQTGGFDQLTVEYIVEKAWAK